MRLPGSGWVVSERCFSFYGLCIGQAKAAGLFQPDRNVWPPDPDSLIRCDALRRAFSPAEPALAQGAEGHAVFQVGTEDRQQQQRQIPSHVHAAVVDVPELRAEHHRGRTTQQRAEVLLRRPQGQAAAQRRERHNDRNAEDRVVTLPETAQLTPPARCS